MTRCATPTTALMALFAFTASGLEPHPDAKPNTHTPGEVDVEANVEFIVTDSKTLDGIVLDETDAVLKGDWQYSTHTPPYLGIGYLHDQKTDKGAKSVSWTPDIPKAGRYEVRVSHCYNVRRSTRTPITIRHAEGETKVRINQRETPYFGKLFRSLGVYEFKAGTSGSVTISNDGTEDGYVIADAVQFLGRLETPPMIDEPPVAGKRVRQTATEYKGTEVYHSLYLPTDWKPGGSYPVIVEYTGNHHPASGSSGEVKDANLGYGLSGGEEFIWVVLPCVEGGRKKNAIKWWGDLEATLDYCKTNLPRICETFGGDPENVILCGFSRGAIAANYLGLADDEIASLWKGFVTHDHYDGVFKVSDAASALERLARLEGRPQLICDAAGTAKTKRYLEANGTPLDNIRFLDVPVHHLFEIPDGKIVHPHTDQWMHIDSRYRDIARQWLRDLIEG